MIYPCWSRVVPEVVNSWALPVLHMCQKGYVGTTGDLLGGRREDPEKK